MRPSPRSYLKLVRNTGICHSKSLIPFADDVNNNRVIVHSNVKNSTRPEFFERNHYSTPEPRKPVAGPCIQGLSRRLRRGLHLRAQKNSRMCGSRRLKAARPLPHVYGVTEKWCVTASASRACCLAMTRRAEKPATLRIDSARYQCGRLCRAQAAAASRPSASWRLVGGRPAHTDCHMSSTVL